MKVPDLFVGKRLIVGDGYPQALKLGLDEVRGSSYIEGPLAVGNVARFPVIPAALMVAPQVNQDVKTASKWSAYFHGGVRVKGLIVGDVVAATKAKPFVIDHPTKPLMKLVHVALEGPENGVYVRGRLTNQKCIELPEYWLDFVDVNSITVQLQPIGSSQSLIIDTIKDNKIYIKEASEQTMIDCYYHVYGTRKDIEKLKVEVSPEEYGL
jgi:hypothetical protein